MALAKALVDFTEQSALCERLHVFCAQLALQNRAFASRLLSSAALHALGEIPDAIRRTALGSALAAAHEHCSAYAEDIETFSLTAQASLEAAASQETAAACELRQAAQALVSIRPPSRKAVRVFLAKWTEQQAARVARLTESLAVLGDMIGAADALRSAFATDPPAALLSDAVLASSKACASECDALTVALATLRPQDSSGAAATAAVTTDLAVLPPGWEAHVHAEYGRVFYHHAASRTSIWDVPTHATDINRARAEQGLPAYAALTPSPPLAPLASTDALRQVLSGKGRLTREELAAYAYQQ